MVNDTAFIFHMCIPCAKTFALLLRSRSTITVTFFQNWSLWGHECFTNTALYDCRLLELSIWTKLKMRRLVKSYFRHNSVVDCF